MGHILSLIYQDSLKYCYKIKEKNLSLRFIIQNSTIATMPYKISSLIISFFLLGILSLNAQKISIEGGYFNPKQLGPNTSKTYFDAVRIGANYDFDLKYNFAIQTGLHYNIAYANKAQSYDNIADSIIYRTWSHALEVPARIVYYQPIYKSLKFFGFMGPNFQIGLVQNRTTESYLDDPSIFPNIVSGKSSMYKPDVNRVRLKQGLNRINVQLGAGGGVQWRGFIIKGGYDWGINNLDKSKGDYVRQSNWYASFAYQIR